jgi:hypothetical protein
LELNALVNGSLTLQVRNERHMILSFFLSWVGNLKDLDKLLFLIAEHMQYCVTTRQYVIEYSFNNRWFQLINLQGSLFNLINQRPMEEGETVFSKIVFPAVNSD